MPSRSSLRTSSRQTAPPCDSATVQGDSIIRAAPPKPSSTTKFPHDSSYERIHLSKRIKLSNGENQDWGYFACNDITSQPSFFSTTSPASTATLSQSGPALSPIGGTDTTQSTTSLANSSKFINGEEIRHKIERENQKATTANNSLKPPESDKRTLRSQDGGSRSKSELALYFPNYEELISTEPKEAGNLSLNAIYQLS